MLFGFKIVEAAIKSQYWKTKGITFTAYNQRLYDGLDIMSWESESPAVLSKCRCSRGAQAGKSRFRLVMIDNLWHDQ